MSSRKEKRRSSFVHGRKVIGKTEEDCPNNLPCFVPVGFSDTERVAYLDVEHALATLPEELPDIEEIQQFTVRAREEVADAIHNHRTTLCVPNVRPDPYVDSELRKLPPYIATLRKEQEEWKELERLRQESSDNAQSLVDSLANNPRLHCPSNLSTRDRDFLDKRPNYNEIERDVAAKYHCCIITIKAFQQNIDDLAVRCNREQSSLQRHAHELSAATFGECVDDTRIIEWLQECSMDTEPY